MRAEDAVLHGCIPVVIMDEVHAVYESILVWDSFSVRVNQASVKQLPEILLSIPKDKVQRMQPRLRRVWHRCERQLPTQCTGTMSDNHLTWYGRSLTEGASDLCC
jgi:hypothetical protein